MDSPGTRFSGPQLDPAFRNNETSRKEKQCIKKGSINGSTGPPRSSPFGDGDLHPRHRRRVHGQNWRPDTRRQPGWHRRHHAPFRRSPPRPNFTVKDESGSASSNNIAVSSEGAETIDGSATDVINLDYESKSYYSDGSNWFILPSTTDTDTQNTYEAPAMTLGTSNVEGTGNSIRSGATVLAFDATDSSTQVHSDAAAVGSATVAARRDHEHAMPAACGGAVTRDGGNTIEASTTSTSAVDMLAVDSLTIAAIASMLLIVSGRKSSGPGPSVPLFTPIARPVKIHV
jgi:hypothetical protein